MVGLFRRGLRSWLQLLRRAYSLLHRCRDRIRILVVDSNDDNRYALTLHLELHAYTHIIVAEVVGEQVIPGLEKESFKSARPSRAAEMVE